MLDSLVPSHLYGIVDMGSNGIRFSITDLNTESARSLPTVFQDRTGISLFDAQYSTGEKGPIPQDVIDEVVAGLLRFKATCADFHVPETNIRILATEATRTAANSTDYRNQIRNATGWEVDMLPKEMEGRVGAMGIASSFSSVEGLVMDLGGGSTQITWMVAQDGDVQTSPKGSFSFPYGAAALTRQLASLETTKDPLQARVDLAAEMRNNFIQAFTGLDLPDTLSAKAQSQGLTLYLSGGGFRGWGYLLMSQHKISPYPIPIINGFQVRKRDFQKTANIQTVAAEQSIFRVSARRAAQVPAVAFLVNVLVSAIPAINDIRFCQGGVREGFLYDTLDRHTRAIDPLPAATAQYGTSSSPALSQLFRTALPQQSKELDRSVPLSISPSLLRALSDLMYLHSSLPKESASLAALSTPITGQLTSAHGISHTDRALLSLTLSARWDGDLPSPYDDIQTRLRGILSVQEVWWAHYVGMVARFVASVYPSGHIPNMNKPRLAFSCAWENGLGKKGLEQGVHLHVHVREGNGDVMTSTEVVGDAAKGIESVGKKKNRIGEFGLPVEISVERDLV